MDDSSLWERNPTAQHSPQHPQDSCPLTCPALPRPRRHSFVTSETRTAAALPRQAQQTRSHAGNLRSPPTPTSLTSRSTQTIR